MFERIEVRCCCVPNKLLGWIDVPDPKYYKSYVFPYYTGETPDPRNMEMHWDLRSIKLKIEPIIIEGKTSMAFKAEGYTPEQLRKLSQFLENPEQV